MENGFRKHGLSPIMLPVTFPHTQKKVAPRKGAMTTLFHLHSFQRDHCLIINTRIMTEPERWKISRRKATAPRKQPNCNSQMEAQNYPSSYQQRSFEHTCHESNHPSVPCQEPCLLEKRNKYWVVSHLFWVGWH